MTETLQRPPKAGTETPLFVVSTHRGYSSASAIIFSVHRMDGLPETDARGEKLRSDRENWLTAREALRLLATMVGALPRY